MKDICLCIVKDGGEVHSIGVNNSAGRYYSQEGGGYLDLERKKHLFEYKEMSWKEFRETIKIN